MSDLQSPERIARLAERMRQEWDRRIAHDYRYWMSDGVADDRTMWEVGARDFAILTKGLSPQLLATQTALEIGCGVGRLLRPAGKAFRRVIGIDVSQEAISQAQTLLQDCTNVELILGSGVDLRGVGNASVDFAYTFAAMSSMPVAVFAQYLVELGRVVRPGGEARLQLYLGREQPTIEEDTLAIRAYEKSRFAEAAALAGFDLLAAEELVLNFEISDKENGLVAEIVRLRRTLRMPEAPERVSAVLARQTEHNAKNSWEGSKTEYLMALARAQQHLDNGSLEGAAATLEFAIRNYQDAEAEVKALLKEIQQKLGNAAAPGAPATEIPSRAAPLVEPRSELQPHNAPHSNGTFVYNTGAAPQLTGVNGTSHSTSVETAPLVQLPRQPGALGECFSEALYRSNLGLLAERFPEVAAALDRVTVDSRISARRSGTGPTVLYFGKTCLSHPEKPVRAAEVWASRSLEGRAGERPHLLVIGFADGYHLQALLQSGKALHVFEPRPDVLKAALGVVDLRAVLSRISSLVTSAKEVPQIIARAPVNEAEVIIHPQTKAVSGEAADEARRLFQAERGWGGLRPNIGVVGPMYGGSLPIAGYTSRALQHMKQRVTGYDLSPFYGPFNQVAKVLRTTERRNLVESQYVEMMSQMVLESINERPLEILICLAQAPMSPRVLSECRARGIITVMWFVEDCRRFTTWQQIAPYYDYMFLIQRDEFPKLVEQAGAGRAIYLPVGCDPGVHRPLAVSEEERRKFGSQLSFVGAGYNNRRHVFSGFANRDFKIWGTEWPACLPFTRLVQDNAARVSVEDYVKVFNSSEININLHSSQERDGVEPFGDFVNPRTFELAACGAFQLVDNRTLLPENFIPGTEVATFSDERDLHEKIDYFLAHPDERARIVAAGRARALAEHTYEHRIRAMLDYIYADRYEQIRAKVEQGPWPKTLTAAQKYSELGQRFERVYDRGDEPVLDSLVADITTGKGTLTETEQKLLFLHHIKSQISHVRKLRKE